MEPGRPRRQPARAPAQRRARRLDGGGIRQLFYFQVDNPSARVLDPVFMGTTCSPGRDVDQGRGQDRPGRERVGIVARVAGGPPA
jgi:hypothetical protein